MAGKPVSAQETITVSIESQSEPGPFHFEVSPQLGIGAFLQHVLDRLAQGDNAARVRNMKNYYEPVLELYSDGTVMPVDSGMTLQQAGIGDRALCRIAARPRKERIMFCNSGN